MMVEVNMYQMNILHNDYLFSRMHNSFDYMDKAKHPLKMMELILHVFLLLLDNPNKEKQN
jgi:hypothetical protein